MLDTLVCDTAHINAWERCGQYAYSDQLVRPNRSFFEELLRMVGEKFGFWEYRLQQMTATQLLGFFAVVVVLMIGIYWLWQNRYRWAGRMQKEVRNVNYTIADENIYGVDFERLLAEAIQLENHSETVRLVYLRQLRRLADAGTLFWKAGLTPDDYVKSIPPGNDRQVLQRITAAYVRIRFGHYEANAAQAKDMVNLAAANVPLPKKGGEQ